MRWFSRQQGAFEEAGEAARRVHSAWLTRALSSHDRIPRIPLRPEARGGFDRLRARANAAELTERWWHLALDRVLDQADSL